MGVTIREPEKDLPLQAVNFRQAWIVNLRAVKVIAG
jgi:hypothetical protein